MTFEPGTFPGLEDTEVELFRKHLDGLRGLGVEIGCCDGYSTRHILAFSQLHLTSIDPMVRDPVETHLVGNLERLYKNLEGYMHRWQFLNITSMQAQAIWPNSEIQFLFIDGDHSYRGVEMDFNMWTPRLETGGFLAMHDCRMGRPGGAQFHPGPSMVADGKVFGRPDKWEIVGEAFSTVLARKL